VAAPSSSEYRERAFYAGAAHLSGRRAGPRRFESAIERAFGALAIFLGACEPHL
jgi:hypothetical protein